MHTGGDTTRFRGMWLVDSSHRNTVVRALMGRGKIVKRWPVCSYKRVGDHCFILFLSNTSCRYKRLFGTPVVFSVMCSLWKMRPIVLDLLPTFCELMIEGDLKLWWFPERSHSSTNKYSHFRGLEKVITFEWYPTIVAEKLGYFNKWRLFGAPLFDCPRNACSGSATGQHDGLKQGLLITYEKLWVDCCRGLLQNAYLSLLIFENKSMWKDFPTCPLLKKQSLRTI